VRALRSIVAAACLVLAGCGGSSGAGGPQETLDTALEHLREAPGITARVTLRSTPESLQALAADGSKSLSLEDARKILDSSLTVSGSNSDDPAEASSRIVVEAAGRNSLEVRVVDQTLYVQADVPYLLETFGQPPAAAQAFVQQATAAGLSFVGPFVEGRWIALQGFDRFMQQSGNETPSAEQKKALDDLLEALRSSASVTSAGEDPAGEHLVVRVNLRDVARHVADAAGALGQSVPTGGLAPEGVPDKEVALDLWVQDDSVSRIEFDLLQVPRLGDEEIPDGVEALTLRVDLSEFSGEVEVPGDAIPVDPAQVMQAFMGGAQVP
jgi:hypothetical protein